MHTASYEFLMKPKESAGCHQTLSARVGSGDETISCQDKHFIDAFFSSFSAFASPLSRSKAYNTAELSCIQIAIVSSVRINIRQCTSKCHGTRRYYGIIRNSRNVGKLSACANSGYQALFRTSLGTRLAESTA